MAVDKQFVREEIACVLKLAPSTANARLHLAGELVRRLPETLDQLERGTIGMAYARCLAESVGPLPDEAALLVQARVLGASGRQTLSAFRASVARAVLALDPRRAEAQHRNACERRRVEVRMLEHGMGSLYAELPAEAVQAIATRVQAAADTLTAADRRAAADRCAAADSLAAAERPEPVETVQQRTADQVRADALVALVTGQDLDLRATWQGRRPSVQVSVALSTLLALDEEPGELDGYGPIPAQLARRIAADPTGTWRRLVTDPLGGVIDVGRDAYEPPQNLTEHVIARDRTCRFPGCRRRARRCEIDHQTPWGQDGRTNECNLECLCSRHHHLKHEAGWTVLGNPNDPLLWITPTGHTYLDPPGRNPIDTTTVPSVTEACPF